MLQLWVASACNSSFPVFLVATLLRQLGDCNKEQFHTFDSSQTVCTVTMQQSKNIGLSPSNSNKALILLCLFCSVIERERDAILGKKKKKKEVIQWAWLFTVWLAQRGRKQEYKSLSICFILGFAVEFVFFFFPSDEEVEWFWSASCLSPGGHTNLGMSLLHGSTCLSTWQGVGTRWSLRSAAT